MRPARAAPGWLTARAYAHRGLHGPDRPENSLPAARAAIAAGHGIECDVRLSRDDVAHVFHDRALARLTGARGRFGDLDSARIATLRLRAGTDAGVPRLEALLALTGVHTPLLIEIKSDDGPRHAARLCAAIAGLLARHDGPAAIMSFDPLVCRWFARHLPAVPHGLVIGRRHRTGIMARRGLARTLARSGAQFIACDVRDLPRARAIPRRTGRPLLSWTVRTPAAWDRVARHADQAIFEGEAR